MVAKNRSRISPYSWRIFAALAVLAAVVALIVTHRGRSVAKSPSGEGFMQGVTHVTLAGPDSAAKQKHLEAVREWVATFEHCISSRSESSELARLNLAAAGEPVAVSEQLFDALAAGMEWHQRTEGAFDITFGPLLTLWRVSAIKEQLPSEVELATARALVGADRLVLGAKTCTVEIPVEGMRIDLGGLGKGLCADGVAKLLRERGVTSALVAVGGDIHVMGTRENGKPWRVGIQDPRRPTNPTALIGTLELADKAVSTSGNYERYVTIQGKRYSHIVDPRTGRPANDVPSVTVIGPNALVTDIMGTALSVMGVEAGLALVERMPEVEAMFIAFDDEDSATITRSSGFSAYEAN